MDEQELEKKLRKEGFTRIYFWEDRPHAFYPDHTHRMNTAHIILDGEMTVTPEGTTETYKTGQRFDVPAGTPLVRKSVPTGADISLVKNSPKRTQQNILTPPVDYISHTTRFKDNNAPTLP